MSDKSPSHSSTLRETERSVASDVKESASSKGHSNNSHIYSELNHLRSVDNKLYGSKGAEHFSHDVNDINHYLKSQHLPGFDTGVAGTEKHVLDAAKEGQNSKDFSGVYAYLKAQHDKDDQQYGEKLGNLLFSQDVKDINTYLHQHHLSNLTITDNGSNGFSVQEKQPNNTESTVSSSASSSSTMQQQGVEGYNSSSTPQGQEAGATQAALGNYVGGGDASSGSTAGSSEAVTPSGASLSGGEQANANQIMSLLINKYGLTPAGAAAIVGNMTQENSLSTAFNSGGAGLCQWIGSRQGDLENWCKQNGLSATSVQGQVGFMMHELQGSYGGLLNELKTTNNASQAAADFSSQYERPGTPELSNREGYAVSALKNYKPSAA